MFPQFHLTHILILHNEDQWELCHSVGSCTSIQAVIMEWAPRAWVCTGPTLTSAESWARLSPSLWFQCLIMYPCWCQHSRPLPLLHKLRKWEHLAWQTQGIWECSAFKSGQVHAQLRLRAQISIYLPGYTRSSSSSSRVCNRFFQQSKGDIDSSWISSRIWEKRWASPKPKWVFRGNTFSKRPLM